MKGNKQQNKICFAKGPEKSPLTVANRTVNLGVDAMFFAKFDRHLFLLFRTLRFPVELRDKLFWSKMRVRVSVTFNTPSHRQGLVLVNLFHLVDATMTGDARDTRIDVSRVIEINEFGQVVNPFPGDAATRLPGLVDRLQLGAVRMNRCQGRDAILVGGTVAIDARCRWRDRSVSGIKDGVVAIPTIHLQLTRVNCVTKRNRLLGLVADIECNGVRQKSAHDASKHGTRGASGGK